jgi:hypothetical protein
VGLADLLLSKPNHILTLDDVRALSSTDKAALRFKCQTDIFFVSNNVLRGRYAPLDPEFHGQLADAFVRPDPRRPIEAWSALRTRIIMAPRGALKSTLACSWAVCCLLANADFRLLILAGDIPLGESHSLRIQRALVENEVIAHLFPEYKPKRKGPIKSPEYICAARSKGNLDRDASISVTSFYAVRAGRHADCILLDDVTSETSSATREMRERTCAAWEDTTPVLDPGAFVVINATRYAADMDLPEVMREQCEEEDKESGVRNHKYVAIPVWQLKTTGTEAEIQARLGRQKSGKLTPADVDFAWSRFNRREIWNKYRRDPAGFACQYLLAPQEEQPETAVFSRGLLDQQTRPLCEMPFPQQSQIFVNWDLSGVSGKRDFSCGVVGMRECTGRVFLLAVILFKATSSTEIVTEIIQAAKDFSPVAIRIETGGSGSRLLEGELLRAAAEAGVNLKDKLIWQAASSEKNAKSKRIVALLPALQNDTLQFYSGAPGLEELKERLAKWPAIKFDDGPDSLGQFLEWVNEMELPTGPATPLGETDLVLGPVLPFDESEIPARNTSGEDRASKANEKSAAAYMKKQLNPYGGE